MPANDFFTERRLKDLRDEVSKLGFTADHFLTETPDCPVFGVNLACAYPLPKEVTNAYTALAKRLNQLGKGVYVYPPQQTHVTIATFVNFAQHQSPTPVTVTLLRRLVDEVIHHLEGMFAQERGDSIRAFDLYLESPIISRKAAFIPISNPTGEIVQMRGRVADTLIKNRDLGERLESQGLNIPSIIHSTIMRFKSVPHDTRRFLSGFDTIALSANLGAMRISEVLVTIETKPYMRAGSIIRRFRLEDIEKR